ncbi:hypothetical protein D187_007342 [Cystobacter fuscus DSM 2262]|uniref:Uncharacterized protein n=1 Tax=Cystobacter fuscus (strain ATCC 25194 / DSM 2262 / NBRC 100088 / M29) TaxID=1242864 RepID=S9P196_CYSF2|nr:hypothetical protein D187_007342 [Cystobacter fuscus DSM 2262]
MLVMPESFDHFLENSRDDVHLLRRGGQCIKRVLNATVTDRIRKEHKCARMPSDAINQGIGAALCDLSGQMRRTQFHETPSVFQ